MKISTHRLVNLALGILLLGFTAEVWWHDREAKKAGQVYYAQDTRYVELLAMAAKDSASVKVGDLHSAEQARDSARLDYDQRKRSSKTLYLWLFALLVANLILGWFSERIYRRRGRADAA